MRHTASNFSRTFAAYCGHRYANRDLPRRRGLGLLLQRLFDVHVQLHGLLPLDELLLLFAIEFASSGWSTAAPSRLEPNLARPERPRHAAPPILRPADAQLLWRRRLSWRYRGGEEAVLHAKLYGLRKAGRPAVSRRDADGRLFAANPSGWARFATSWTLSAASPPRLACDPARKEVSSGWSLSS